MGTEQELINLITLTGRENVSLLEAIKDYFDSISEHTINMNNNLTYPVTVLGKRNRALFTNTQLTKIMKVINQGITTV